MKIEREEAAWLRDELHNLDIGNKDDSDMYYRKLFHIIASGEDFKPRIYGDSKKIPTIGYGFNMGRGDASRKEWDALFDGAISFDDAKAGRISITKKQARMLKESGIAKREMELKKIYAPYWNQMRLNERAVIVSANVKCTTHLHQKCTSKNGH